MQDIEHTLTYLRDNGKKYAKAKADYEYIKEFRKSKKAILKVEAERQGITQATKQEDYAYSHPDYLQLLDGLKVACEEEAKMRQMMETARQRLELWRTEQANERIERKAYNA